MSKFNVKKEKGQVIELAGQKVKAKTNYSDLDLLRRVTLANLLFESNYYQSGDTIAQQMEMLISKVPAQQVIDLAIEVRNEQKLRHTGLWMLSLVMKHHGTEGIREGIEKMNFRPDMCMDLLKMVSIQKGHNNKLRNIPQAVRKGINSKLESFSEYQLGKYNRSNSEISLVDVVNLTHPKATPALSKLMNGELKAPNTWEVALSQGANKAATFERMINEKSLGSMAILRNLRNMKEAGLSRRLIVDALSQVNSSWLLPLDFLKAVRIMPEYSAHIEEAMQRSFSHSKIPGTTILAIDVSGSMRSLTSSYSSFSRLDRAFASAILANYIFEDVIIVMTAGNDRSLTGSHVVWNNSKGFGLINDYSTIKSKVGGGGIFTYQLCEWLKSEGLAKDANRLVVFSDSQDVDVSHGKKLKKPDTSPYDYSYIIDISSQTHGIKTENWTAEITGVSDAIFRYISALENV